MQGTINGLGERCGNANLMSIIPTLFLKKTFSNKFDLNIKKEKLTSLTECSRFLDEVLNKKPNKSMAYVGGSAFSHKGGLHVSAVKKDPKTYEHIDPKKLEITGTLLFQIKLEDQILYQDLKIMELRLILTIQVSKKF